MKEIFTLIFCQNHIHVCINLYLYELFVWLFIRFNLMTINWLFVYLFIYLYVFNFYLSFYSFRNTFSYFCSSQSHCSYLRISSKNLLMQNSSSNIVVNSQIMFFFKFKCHVFMVILSTLKALCMFLFFFIFSHIYNTPPFMAEMLPIWLKILTN